jgi:rRNA maturation RNase YbeY
MAVLVKTRLRAWRIQQRPLEQVAEALLTLLGESHSELGLELIGDRRMRRLNAQHRQIDRTTDVLAFPMRESTGPLVQGPLLGDVVISVPTADRQGRELGHPLSEEVLRLLIHGVLHVLGYDHERGPSEARRMQRREVQLYRKLMPVGLLVAGRK